MYLSIIITRIFLTVILLCVLLRSIANGALVPTRGRNTPFHGNYQKNSEFTAEFSRITAESADLQWKIKTDGKWMERFKVFLYLFCFSNFI